MPQPLKIVQAHFPPWSAFEAIVRERLEIAEHESTRFHSMPACLDLPEALWLDLNQVAEQLGPGWDLGRVLSFLAVHGAIRVCEQAEQAGTS